MDRVVGSETSWYITVSIIALQPPSLTTLKTLRQSWLLGEVA